MRKGPHVSPNHTIGRFTHEPNQKGKLEFVTYSFKTTQCVSERLAAMVLFGLVEPNAIRLLDIRADTPNPALRFGVLGNIKHKLCYSGRFRTTATARPIRAPCRHTRFTLRTLTPFWTFQSHTNFTVRLFTSILLLLVITKRQKPFDLKTQWVANLMPQVQRSGSNMHLL